MDMFGYGFEGGYGKGLGLVSKVEDSATDQKNTIFKVNTSPLLNLHKCYIYIN